MKSAAGRAHERRRKDEQEERYGREAELAEPWVAGSHVGDGDAAAREIRHLQWVDEAVPVRGPYVYTPIEDVGIPIPVIYLSNPLGEYTQYDEERAAEERMVVECNRPCLRQVTITEEQPCSRYGPYRTCYTHDGCLETDAVIEVDSEEEEKWLAEH